MAQPFTLSDKTPHPDKVPGSNHSEGRARNGGCLANKTHDRALFKGKKNRVKCHRVSGEENKAGKEEKNEKK